MRRSRSTAAALLTMLALLTVSIAPVAAGGPSGEAKAKAKHQRIVKYWTAERIANASTRDFVRNADGSFSMIKARPNKGKPGGGGGHNVIGASWNGGGAILKISGKVLFTMDSGDYICSGTVAKDASNNDRSIVVSAGHCAYDAADGGFARNWTFYPEFDTSPSYDCPTAKWGCWTATALAVHNGFAQAGGFNTQATTYDWSFAALGTGGKAGNLLEQAVGTLPISFSAPAVGAQTFNFGYPAAGKYHGSDLVYCADQVFLDPQNQNLTLGIDCDMTGGSSGGPWLAGFVSSTGIGTVDSVNSYGYGGVKKEYGPRFNSTTQATFNAAVSASGNVLVGTAP